MLGFFAAEGLETGLVERRVDRVPGLYAISVDAAGERSFTYWRETSAARTLFLPPCEVAPGRLAGFDLVYFSAITLAILAPAAREALASFLAGYREQGGRVAFDSNYRPRLWPDAATAKAEVARFWALTDIGLPSLDDELALYGEADEAAVLARLAAAGVRRGALKRGRRGSAPARGGRTAPGLPAGGAGGRHHRGGGQLQRRLPRGPGARAAGGRLPRGRARAGERGDRPSGGDRAPRLARAPKTAEPTRTWVAPQAIAVSKSSLMPMERPARPWRPASSASRRKWGSGSSSTGGIVISPKTGRSRPRQVASRASSPSGSTPAFCGSRPVLTWTKSVGQAPLRLHRAGELLGEAGAVEAVDGVEQRQRAVELVGLQRADEVQARRPGSRRASGAPARLGLLHAVLAEDPLAGVEHRAHPVGRLHLGDGDERHRPGRAAGARRWPRRCGR